MARRSLNELTADNGYGLMLGLGVLLVAAGAFLIAAGRDGSALVWMGGLLVALGAFGRRIQSVKLPGGGEVTLDAQQAVLSALDTVKADAGLVAPVSAGAEQPASPSSTGPGLAPTSGPPVGSRLSVPIAGSYWSDEVLRQATVAAGSNSMKELGEGLARLVRAAQAPGGSIYSGLDESIVRPAAPDLTATEIIDAIKEDRNHVVRAPRPSAGRRSHQPPAGSDASRKKP